uniref:Predicted protein n=1 Tax=Hordeum vulgare subsp. vulgare TaxID=112509 RepID=F2EL89_HORVV|nr:predicted protein [Hordeum vulgare subsp. vulgare]
MLTSAVGASSVDASGSRSSTKFRRLHSHAEDVLGPSPTSWPRRPLLPHLRKPKRDQLRAAIRVVANA